VEKTFFGGQSDSDESVVHKKSDAYDQWIASSAGIEASKKLSAVDRIRGIKPPEPGSFTAGAETPAWTNVDGSNKTITKEAENVLESKEISNKKWIDLPFELQAVDGVMHVVCGILTDDATELQEVSLDYIQYLVNGRKMFSNEDPLLVIRQTKDAVQEMTSRINRFITSLHMILNHDEDMALMNLSRLITHPRRFIKPISREQLHEE
jgi:hypothetical protein